MIETESLILDKAKFSDWKEMYYNVWSQPESAKYMSWSITTNEEKLLHFKKSMIHIWFMKGQVVRRLALPA